jgi:hypothetical protein
VDELLLPGVSCGQLGAGLVEGAPGVEGGVPLERADLGEEALPLGLVGDQVPVQVARVPVEQDPTDVEDDGLQAGDVTRSRVGAG